MGRDRRTPPGTRPGSRPQRGAAPGHPRRADLPRTPVPAAPGRRAGLPERGGRLRDLTGGGPRGGSALLPAQGPPHAVVRPRMTDPFVDWLPVGALPDGPGRGPLAGVRLAVKD